MKLGPDLKTRGMLGCKSSNRVGAGSSMGSPSPEESSIGSSLWEGSSLLDISEGMCPWREDTDLTQSNQLKHEVFRLFICCRTDVSLANRLRHEGHWALREEGALAVEGMLEPGIDVARGFELSTRCSLPRRRLPVTGHQSQSPSPIPPSLMSHMHTSPTSSLLIEQLRALEVKFPVCIIFSP